MKIEQVYKIVKQKYPNVVFDTEKYYENEDSFVVVEDWSTVPVVESSLIDDPLTVVVDKKTKKANDYLCVFTYEFLETAKVFIKKNNTWISMPAIEDFE
jgi:hypothetical protein